MMTNVRYNGLEGDTLLHIAAKADDAEIFEWLSENGLKIDLKNFDGQTARDLAGKDSKSIQSADRLLALQNELTHLKKYDILGLAETWIAGQTCSRLTSGEYLYNSGKLGDSRFSGVGLLISAEMNRKVVGVKYVSDRIIQVLLKLRAGKTLRITQVYAPQSGRGEDEYDLFLDQLSSSLDRPVTNDIVLGDFNASTGPCQNGVNFCLTFV
uniref:Uncharacterized protein n=1 Tax=Panagrolaimus davidi TaxID=227884 RepID=A0A914QXF9_9BILA